MEPHNPVPRRDVSNNLSIVGYPPPEGGGVVGGSPEFVPGQGGFGPEMSGVVPSSAMGHVGHGPRGYTRPDERILDDVCERLALDPMTDAREVGVQVEDGEVILTGELEDRQMKHTAEDIAASVWGVKDVNNQIRIRPAEDKADK
jgi:hypothetical protein